MNDPTQQQQQQQHTFNGPFSGTTQVSRYQKGKTSLDFTEVSGSGISWAICKSATLQTDNHASTPSLSFYRPDAFPATQPTVSKAMKTLHNSITITIMLHDCFVDEVAGHSS